MAHRNDLESLRAAWRALSDNSSHQGWNTIDVDRIGLIRVMAGRHFPGNEEALLAGFQAPALQGHSTFPSGKGFSVSIQELSIDGTSSKWIALIRQAGGSPELFSSMAEDVLGVLESMKDGDERTILGAFLARIFAWQEFMEREREHVLGREAEIGLFGELVMLSKLLEAGLYPTKAIESWHGPLHGLHDFVLGEGALEAKSSIAASGFVASIGSLEQMDESIVSPLFLACIRLSQNPQGDSLPELVEGIQESIRSDRLASSLFASRLLQGGYFAPYATQYGRRFKLEAVMIFPVGGGFPRVTRASVPPGVLQARYEIEIDGLNLPVVALHEALEQLGATTKWN